MARRAFPISEGSAKICADPHDPRCQRPTPFPTAPNALYHQMLRIGPVRVSYSSVISTLVLPYPATRGDSRLGRIVSRVCSAEAVVGRVCALVAVVVRSRPVPGDRTLLRLLASLLAHLLAPARRAMGGVRGICLLYTSDAADDLLCVDLGGRR